MVGRTRQRLAAYALITDAAGRVLLTRLPAGAGPGRWLLPGGGVEHGEHPELAVIREVMEETGMRASAGPLFDVISDVATVGRRRWSLHTVRLIYLADIVPDEPGQQSPELADDARWYAPAEYRALELAPFTARVLSSVAG